jgi:PBP1b-binding outer membrane lipoprotein LpoB
MMTPRINFSLIIGTLMISGCSNVTEFVHEVNAKHQQQRMAVAKSSCKEYGFIENSDSFATCIQNEVNQIKNREAMSQASFQLRFHDRHCKIRERG